jgi:transposase-like protein
LQATIPHLSRSALHRCYQRHGISRLPDVSSDKSTKKKFRKYPIGYFHIDSAEVRTEEGRLYLFVAVDRTSKFAYVELHERQTKMIAAAFLRNLIAAVPCKIHTILTDSGIRFTNRRQDRYAFTHVFDRVCDENTIKHRLTQVKHPWTNGQVERMNRTIKEATVKRYQYGSHEQLKTHVYDFMMACNFAKRLKTLKGLTSYEYICKIWTKEPERFSVNPFQHTVGLNTIYTCNAPPYKKPKPI